MTAELVAALDQTWRASSDLLHTLSLEQWQLPTGCPSWTVHDVTSHLVWSARLLGGHPVAPIDPPDAEWLTSPVARYMERDVEARRDTPSDEVLAELDRHRTETVARLNALAPDRFDSVFVGPMEREMPYASYLPIAVLDEWVHGEDIRRAVDAPMEDDTSAFTHSMGQLVHVLSAKPFVPCELQIGPPVNRVVRLGDGGVRARIGLTARDFVARAAGRSVAMAEAQIDGDRTAADAVLRSLTVTP